MLDTEGKVPGLDDRRQGVGRRHQGGPLTETPAAPRLIDRSDLVAALDRAAESKVTVISAPAGSGKTSLLRAWADRPGGTGSPSCRCSAASKTPSSSGWPCSTRSVSLRPRPAVR